MQSYRLPFSPLSTDVLERISKGSFVHTLNFHSTPVDKVDAYDKQLEHYGNLFYALGELDLDTLFKGRGLPHYRPGLIVALFNGYRNNYDVAAPLLECHGLRGWFFIPSRFLSVPVADQEGYAARSKIRVRSGEYADGRVAMTWDEVRDLRSRGHVIACHTRSHQLAAADALSPEALHAEIVLSQGDFSRELGQSVHTFAWIYGSGYGVNPAADATLKAAGYRYLFSNSRLQRLS